MVTKIGHLQFTIQEYVNCTGRRPDPDPAPTLRADGRKGKDPDILSETSPGQTAGPTGTGSAAPKEGAATAPRDS